MIICLWLYIPAVARHHCSLSDTGHPGLISQRNLIPIFLVFFSFLMPSLRTCY
jgi:hypothetical protein